MTLVRWYGASLPGTARRDDSSRSISRTDVSACATKAPLAAPTSGCAGRARASVGNRRPQSLDRSMSPPGPPIACQQLIRRRRAPGAGGIVRKRRPVARPCGDDRIDERPLLLDLVDPGEQGRIAEHRVEDQPLVRLGQSRAKGAAV